MVRASSEDSVRTQEAFDYQKKPVEDSDQPAHSHMLIKVFAGRVCQKMRSLMWRLILYLVPSARRSHTRLLIYA